MTGMLLVLNAGSSSVKFRVFAAHGLAELASGSVSGIGSSPHFNVRIEGGDEEIKELPAAYTQEDGIKDILAWLACALPHHCLMAAGHRVVHGGTEFVAPTRITPEILQRLHALTPLAPLHQPHNLAAITIIADLFPELPQIACFDTAFHANHQPLFSHYAIPQIWRDRGVRPYGFHGLSYEWIALRLREDHPQLAFKKIVVAHLGSGASVCAMENNISIDTTMGMTALDGLPMGTRCGEIDPGAVLFMLRQSGGAIDAIEHMLYEQCGLKGLSGISSDVQTLMHNPTQPARFALDYFTLKTAQFIAKMAISLGGMDALVFTGGIGEHAEELRNAITARVGLLGKFPTLIIAANEERMIAIHVMQKL